MSVNIGFLDRLKLECTSALVCPASQTALALALCEKVACVCLLHASGRALAQISRVRLLACITWRGWLCCPSLCLFLHFSIYLVTHHFYSRSLPLLGMLFFSKPKGEVGLSFLCLKWAPREAVSELFSLIIELWLYYFSQPR